MFVEVDVLAPKGISLQIFPTDATSSDLPWLPLALVMALELCIWRHEIVQYVQVIWCERDRL